MGLILKNGADQHTIKVLKEKLNRSMQKRMRTKGFDAHKYIGIMNIEEDPMVIQQKLRDEWERVFS